jgi:hypothetical protein
MATTRKSPIASVLKVTLDVVWYLAIGLLGLAAVLLGLSVLTDGNVPGHLNIPVLVDIDPHIYSISAPDQGVASAELTDVSAELRFRSPGREFLAFFAFYLLVAVAIVLIVLYQLRNIIATLAAGSPFVAANASRIRLIGWVVIVGELVQEVIEFLGHLAVTASFEAQGLTFRWSLDISLTTIFWGCVLLALAEVFRQGVEMREEHALTV